MLMSARGGPHAMRDSSPHLHARQLVQPLRRRFPLCPLVQRCTQVTTVIPLVSTRFAFDSKIIVKLRSARPGPALYYYFGSGPMTFLSIRGTILSLRTKAYLPPQDHVRQPHPPPGLCFRHIEIIRPGPMH
jgi:hypothetical protein